MSIVRFALLKIPLEIGLIRDEVAALQEQHWHPHLNRYYYEGKWNVLSLRSPGGNNNTMAEAMNNSEFANTELMDHCPAIRRLSENLQCEKLSIRLLNLHVGAVIKEHTDKDLSYEKGEARLHFPVFTNPLVDFFVDNIKVQMNEGECWYINANIPHRLANNGTTARIHLVVDCKVNEWLDDVFRNNFIRKDEISEAALTMQKRDTITNTICELRKQNNPVARDLAIKLEQQLYDAEKNFSSQV